jgi:hypothetical protein
MSKYAKRVVLGILALALVVGSLTASAMPPNEPKKQCNWIDAGETVCYDSRD